MGRFRKEKKKAAEENEEERQEVAVGLAVAKEISLDAALVAATITIEYQLHIKRRTKSDTDFSQGDGLFRFTPQWLWQELYLLCHCCALRLASGQ